MAATKGSGVMADVQKVEDARRNIYNLLLKMREGYLHFLTHNYPLYVEVRYLKEFVRDLNNLIVVLEQESE